MMKLWPQKEYCDLYFLLVSVLFSMDFSTMLTDAFHDRLELRHMNSRLFNLRRLKSVTKVKVTII